jgi:iduronate 2-sulfatase
MISYPGMVDPGKQSNAIVETVDLFATLTDLAGLSGPKGLHGVTLRDQLENPDMPSTKAAYAHWRGGQETVRNKDWRLIVHRSEGEIEGFELFDFRENDHGERRNPDDHPEVVEQLLNMIDNQPE